jgi:hypothetical protein
VLLGTYPDVPIAPFTEIAQFLYLGMQVVNVVFHGKADGVVHADVAAEPEEYSARLIC